MKKYLYKDLYELEEKHWWHVSKRNLCKNLIKKYFKGGKILDVGCGTGKNAQSFEEFGKVWGMDNSQEALRFCSKYRHLINIKKGDAESSGFKSSYFDLVSMLDVLEHTNDKKSLKEMHRILKENGLLLITVPAYKWMWSKWDDVLHHKRRYNKKNIYQTLGANGFQVLKFSYFNSFLLLPVFLIRKIKTLTNKQAYGSDFRIGSSLVNQMMLLFTKIEHLVIEYASIPFGLSIVVLCKKAKTTQSNYQQ